MKLLNIRKESRETLTDALNYRQNINENVSTNTGQVVTEKLLHETLLEIKYKLRGFNKINIDMLLLRCPKIIPL